MYQIGLTGGIGSGKTLVCSVLEKLGVAVYYADAAARMLMNNEPSLKEKVIVLFGSEAYVNGFLNRGFLARQVFGDSGNLEKLNEVVHPAVRRDFSQWVKLQKDAPYVVEEAAILFESGANRFLDASVLVFASEERRIRRVMERDGVDEESVKRRMIHQMDEEEKKKLADYIIYNDEKEMLLPQIIALHQKILNRR